MFEGFLLVICTFRGHKYRNTLDPQNSGGARAPCPPSYLGAEYDALICNESYVTAPR